MKTHLLLPGQEILPHKFLHQQSADRKRWLFTLVIMAGMLSFDQTLFAQDATGNMNDGPYVGYFKDSIEIKSIVFNKGKQAVVTQYFPIAEKSKVNLQIRFTNHRDWDFDVRLQPALTNQVATWDQPSKLLALSDIEGEFEALRNLLIANKVMDKKYNWIFGNGHVVLCGDLFDRGLNVTEQLWLLYKLEQDAKAQGGYLHVILGNHDIMNMSGDLRYVQQKYYKNAILLEKEYVKLFAADTELGQWLRTKNLVEKIGENLCLHAGISAEMNRLQLPVEEINNRCRPYYSKADNAEVLGNKSLSPFFADSTSPFWYRGYFFEPKATQSQVDSTLALYGCKTIIVGHTIVETNVAAYYQNKVFGIDVNQHDDKHEGVLFDNGRWYKINTTGRKRPLFESGK